MEAGKVKYNLKFILPADKSEQIGAANWAGGWRRHLQEVVLFDQLQICAGEDPPKNRYL